MIAATSVLLLGLYAFLDGLFALLLGAQDYGDGRRWWSLMAEGLISVGLGLYAWLRPESGLWLLLNGAAACAVFTGLLEIFQATDLNEYKERRRPLFLAGFSSVAFGVLILLFRTGGVDLVWLIGIYPFTFGLPILVLAFRLRAFTLAG